MQYLFKYRYLFIALFALLIAFSAYQSRKLRFYYDLDKFFPAGDSDLTFLRHYQDELESDDSYVLVAIDNHRSIFDTAFLGRLHTFTLQARHIPHITYANSLPTMSDYIRLPFGFARQPVVHYKDPARLRGDSAQVLSDPRWPGYLVSKDSRVAVVILKTIKHMPENDAEPLVNSLDSLIKVSHLPDVHIVSRAHAQVVFVRKTEQQLRFFIILSMSVLVLIMALVFRRFWGVVIPVLSSIAGLVLFMGFLAVTGQKLDLMSTLYPVLVLTIGMSDVIHIMNKYVEEQMRGRARIEAMQITIKEIGYATLLTCVTTVIGFIASLTIPIEPVRNFSINAAIGVSIAYITVIFLTCMILTFFNGNQLSSQRLQLRFWDKVVQWVYQSGEQYPRRISLIWLLALAVSILGIMRVSENTFLLSDVPRDNKLRQDFAFLEAHLAGARPFEIAVLPKSPLKVSSLPVLRQVDSLERYMDRKGSFGNIISPVVLFKSMNKAFAGGSLSDFRLPDSQEDLNRYDTLLKRGGQELSGAVINSREDMGRMAGRVTDLGSEKMKVLHASLMQWINTHLDTSIARFRITGTAMLVDKNNDYLRANLFQGLALAFVLIAAVMAFLFRSLKMVIISLIPNVFPLIVCGAIMGWMGIELKATTAIIFEIVFGIAVDDTIHFLTQYKLELARGLNTREAVHHTFMETGKAIILTSLILFSGFFVMVFSDFTATYYIGLLMSLTFVSAVLSDLFILPLLLRWAYRGGK